MTPSVVITICSGNECMTFCKGGWGWMEIVNIHPGMALNDELAAVETAHAVTRS